MPHPSSSVAALCGRGAAPRSLPSVGALRAAVFSALGFVQACGGVADPEASPCERAHPGGAADGVAAAAVEADCLAAGGTGCAATQFLSEGAALCIARAEGIVAGPEEGSLRLTYERSYDRPVWSVTEQWVKGQAATLDLDAATGQVLGEFVTQIVPGRPFLVAGKPRTARAVARSDYAAHPDPSLEVGGGLAVAQLSLAERGLLAEQWERIGLMEHASVAAFARFTLQLLALGAPLALVGASQQAQRDELRHAQLAFHMASQYAGRPVGPGSLDLAGAGGLSGEGALEQVATGALLEGCIGETVAALVAREGAEAAVDPAVQAVLAQIAGDEQRHAELAWKFLDWALSQQPRLVSKCGLVVARRLEQIRVAASAPEVWPAGYRPDLSRHGVIAQADQQALECSALEQIVIPAIEALARKHRPAADAVRASQSAASPLVESGGRLD